MIPPKLDLMPRLQSYFKSLRLIQVTLHGVKLEDSKFTACYTTLHDLTFVASWL